jgi:NADPH-dependent curcumin reductase CurA
MPASNMCRDESVKEVLKKEYPQGLDIIYEVGDNRLAFGAAFSNAATTTLSTLLDQGLP